MAWGDKRQLRPKLTAPNAEWYINLRSNSKLRNDIKRCCLCEVSAVPQHVTKETKPHEAVCMSYEGCGSQAVRPVRHTMLLPYGRNSWQRRVRLDYQIHVILCLAWSVENKRLSVSPLLLFPKIIMSNVNIIWTGIQTKSLSTMNFYSYRSIIIPLYGKISCINI